MKEEIAHYHTVIQEAQKQIQRIQSECKHPAYTVTMYMWRPGAMTPARICDECSMSIPGITKEEEAAKWEEWKLITAQQ